MNIIYLLGGLDAAMTEEHLQRLSDQDLARATVLTEALVRKVFGEALRRDPNLSHPSVDIQLESIRNITGRDLEILVEKIRKRYPNGIDP